MTDSCERCGATLDGPPNYLELEVGAERGGGGRLTRYLCDRCSAVLFLAARADYAELALAVDVVDLGDLFGEAEP